MRALLLLLCLLTSQAWATTYYVRDTTACANNGDGSAYACAASNGAPGAIRNFANMLLATFAAGDTVYICGSLISSNSFQWTNAMESGSAGNPIIVDGHCPVGDGTFDEGGFYTTAAYAFRITATGPDHITLRNLTWSGGTTDDISFNLSTTTGITIEDSEVLDSAGDGIDIDDAADGGVKLTNVTVRRAALNGIFCNSMAGFVWSGIRVYDSGTAGDNNTDGIGIDDGCGSGSVLTNSEVHDQKGNLGGGIDVQDSTGTGTMLVNGAYIEGGEGSGYTATANAGTLTAIAQQVVSVRNLFNVYLKDTGGSHQLYHFTTANATTTELKIGDSGTSGDVATAIIYNGSFGNAACDAEVVYYRNNASFTLTSNNNQFCVGGQFSLTSGGIVDFTTWKSSTSQDASSVEADPLFILGSNADEPADFHTLRGSPIRWAGRELNRGNIQDCSDRAFTHPPSMGACEATSGDQANARSMR